MTRRLNTYGSRIEDTLFNGRSSTSLFPWLTSEEPMPAKARRNPGEAHCSAPLVEAVAMALRGDVLEARTRLQDRDGLWIRSRPKARTRGERVLGMIDCSIYGLKRVDAYLGVAALVEAMNSPSQASDLMDAWSHLLDRWTRNDRRLSESLAHPIAWAADELWHWLRCGAGGPEYNLDRLWRFQIYHEMELAPDPGADDLAPVLTDPEAFRIYQETGIVVATNRPGAMSRRLEGATFRGPQLGQLVMALEQGMHAILTGPRGTGKSLCAVEAVGFAHKELLTVEGHESLQPVDMLGGYVPESRESADPYELQAEIACLIATGDAAGLTSGSRYRWADGPLTTAMRKGRVLLVDEANRMPGKTLNVLLGALSRRAVVLTEQGSEEVTAAGGFTVVLAMNLGKGYLINQVDPALADRFPVTLEFGYLEPADEAALVRERTGIDLKVARWIVQVAGETRAMRRNRQFAADITPRGLIAWAELCGKALTGATDAGRVLADTAAISWIPGVAGRDADGQVIDENRQLLLQMIANHRPPGV